MGILFPWNWPVEVFIPLGKLLEFVLIIAVMAVVFGYLALVLRCLFLRSAKKHEHDELDRTNAFRCAWQELADGVIGAGKAFAWFGVAIAILLYVPSAFMADLVAWDNHVDATIGKHYKVVHTDHFHRMVTVDEGGCYVTFPEHAYSDVLEKFTGFGKADLSRVDYDWEGTPKQPCLPIRSE